MKTIKILSFILAMLMMVSLCACGEPDDPNSIAIEDYVATFVKAEIIPDNDGNDAIAITFDYQNNSDEAKSFEWTAYHEITQAGAVLEYAPIFVSEDSYDFIDDGASEDVEPGASKEVTITYTLNDTTTPVDIKSTGLITGDTDEMTIDLTTLSVVQ